MNKIEQEITALSHKIVELELRKDADALAAFITDDYVGIDPSGALINKTISVERCRRADFALTQHGVADISVMVLGDTAIEIGVMTLKGHLGTFEFGGRYRYSHVWLKTSTGWQVRASQLTPILRD